MIEITFIAEASIL